ncbi:MAG TPA: SDR family oxidoreductase [Chloroflexota bacterium]|nr:SDR family oxidoreductase [Chloroflexota bacterium]
MTGPAGIITGAGSGIGAATAIEFARLGARLTLAALPIGDQHQDGTGPGGRDLVSAPGLTETVRAVERAGGTAVAVEMDVRDPLAVRQLVDAAVERYGRLDFVLANAGIADQALASEGNPAVWQRLIETNLLGLMYCVRFALPHMQRQRSGHLLLTASTSGRGAYVGEPAYIASKWGVVGFGHSVRMEVASYGIRVTLVEPGAVDTPLTRNAPKIRPLIESITPLQPEDVARAIVFAFQQPAHVTVTELALRPLNQPE